MLARWIATVAALLLACASPQADAYVRAERVSTPLADLAAELIAETAPPAKSASTPKTAPPARARPAARASGKNAALSHCHVRENWSPLQECASMPGVYQWDGTRLAGRTNATGSTLGDYQHAYGWAISSREGAIRSTLHTDVHGTPQLITDGTAAIAGWTRTDVWGVEKAQSGAQSRLGHTGYLKDPLLGDELYAQARQYRAGSGRFTSVDPWEGDTNNPLSLNKYLYGLGNPGSYVDPDGLAAKYDDEDLIPADTQYVALERNGETTYYNTDEGEWSDATDYAGLKGQIASRRLQVQTKEFHVWDWVKQGLSGDDDSEPQVIAESEEAPTIEVQIQRDFQQPGIDIANGAKKYGRVASEVLCGMHPGCSLHEAVSGADQEGSRLDNFDRAMAAAPVGLLGGGLIRSGSRAIAKGHKYEGEVRELYQGIPFAARQYTAIVNGRRVNGVADSVAVLDGKLTAVEAKFVKNWDKSLRNPSSPTGTRPWSVSEQATMMDQARKYSEGFEGGVVYHTNSIELAAHYTSEFNAAGIANFRFVITPAK